MNVTGMSREELEQEARRIGVVAPERLGRHALERRIREHHASPLRRARRAFRGLVGLAKAIAGHPGYEVTRGDVLLEGESVLEMEPDERGRAGLFLAFQYPAEIPGVSISNFLRTAMVARLAEGEDMDIFAFQKRLLEKLEMLKVDPAFAARYVNDGFSGGEKKRNEILQLAMLEPRMAVMDETDSGLDIDALRIVSEGVNTIRGADGGMGVLLITHYKRILNYLHPDHEHVMLNGQIAHSGGAELADRLEEMGYDW